MNDCVADGCGAAVPCHTAIRFSELTRDVPNTVNSYGNKIDAVVRLIQDQRRIEAEDYVLIFVQFGRLKAEVISALKNADIQFSDGALDNKIRKFQAKKGGKVCILDIMSPDAAGWNLQVANHVIFLSSLVTKTHYQYLATYKQAIGRAYRKHQKKDVYVYHFLAAHTIDVNILQDRTGKTLVERNGEHHLLDLNDIEDGDAQGLEGVPFEGAACGAGTVELA